MRACIFPLDVALGGPVFADGVDFGVLAADGRLRAITGFIDHAPSMPAGG